MSLSDFEFQVQSEVGVALAEKALYLPGHCVMLVSDLHFGKVAHFRRHGIGVPAQADMANLQRLEQALARYPTRQLLLLGDAFHSVENQALTLFAAWRKRYCNLSIGLVPGNHDVMATTTYHDLGIDLLDPTYRLGGLHLVHDPADAPAPSPDTYTLAGHVHPGVRLPGAAGALTLPALVLGPEVGLLPSFGTFTGLAPVDVRQARQVLLFSGTSVFELPR